MIGTTEEEKGPGGKRFLDNQRFEGHVAEMVTNAQTYVMSAMRKSSLIEGTRRRNKRNKTVYLSGVAANARFAVALSWGGSGLDLLQMRKQLLVRADWVLKWSALVGRVDEVAQAASSNRAEPRDLARVTQRSAAVQKFPPRNQRNKTVYLSGMAANARFAVALSWGDRAWTCFRCGRSFSRGRMGC